MTARHRRPVPPRQVNKRLVGAGVAGIATVFAVAPLASAEPAQPTSSDAPAEPTQATSTDTPSDLSTDAPADQPSTSASVPKPTSSPAANDPVARKAPKAAAKVAPKAEVTTTASEPPAEPDFGLQKYRVGVQIKAGADVPDGTTTVGTELTITDTDQDGNTDTSTCTTDASTVTAGSSASFCLAPEEDLTRRSPALSSGPSPVDVPDAQLFRAEAGDTITITQTTVNAHLMTDPSTATIEPCNDDIGGYCIAGFDDNEQPIGVTTDVVFDDPGFPPKAVDDSATTKVGTPVAIAVLGNDTTSGATLTGLTVATQPTNGTAVAEQVVQQAAKSAKSLAAAGPQRITYTPKAGFVGKDTFTYTIRTANGTSTATVTVTITAPPPTAVDDSATTPENTPVTIKIESNDDANGGGALTLAKVGDPGHGTVKITGNSVRYTPDDGFTGTDTFDYTIETAYGSDTATVTVTVEGPEPVASTGVASEDLLEVSLALLLAGGVAASAGRRRRLRGRHAG